MMRDAPSKIEMVANAITDVMKTTAATLSQMSPIAAVWMALNNNSTNNVFGFFAVPTSRPAEPVRNEKQGRRFSK